MAETGVTINVDCTSLDAAIEKAKQLVELLKKAQQIAESLSSS